MDDRLSKKNLAGIPVFMALSTFITISIAKSGINSFMVQSIDLNLFYSHLVQKYEGCPLPN
jgi:hypothetical protein